MFISHRLLVLTVDFFKGLLCRIFLKRIKTIYGLKQTQPISVITYDLLEVCDDIFTETLLSACNFLLVNYFLPLLGVSNSGERY